MAYLIFFSFFVFVPRMQLSTFLSVSYTVFLWSVLDLPHLYQVKLINHKTFITPQVAEIELVNLTSLTKTT